MKLKAHIKGPSIQCFNMAEGSVKVWSPDMPTVRQSSDLRILPCMETISDSSCRISYPGGIGTNGAHIPSTGFSTPRRN
jgi:hypothetical protein